MILAREGIGFAFFCSVRINSVQNITWTSAMHSVSSCGAYMVKRKDVQPAVQPSMDQGRLQKIVNTSLEIFSPKKIADSAFSYGFPFVLPLFIKKDLNLKLSFLVSRPLKYFMYFRNFFFFFF